MNELDQFREQAATSRSNIHATHVWALKQSADLRAKAELMRRIDEDIEVYGTADADEVEAVADEIEELSEMVNPYA
jgi:hypothetical protein